MSAGERRCPLRERRAPWRFLDEEHVLLTDEGELEKTEAEYRGAVVTTCEVVWLKRLLMELQVEVVDPTLIYYNNLSSIQLVKNPVFHARTKHIEVHYHFCVNAFLMVKSIYASFGLIGKWQTSSQKRKGWTSCGSVQRCLDCNILICLLEGDNIVTSINWLELVTLSLGTNCIACFNGL